MKHPFTSKKFWAIALPMLLMLAGMWVNTGNLTPYAATLPNPYVADYRGELIDSATYVRKQADHQKTYIVNYDHLLYHANYRMLRGDGREFWWFNNVHRRILYYLAAFPFMRWLGFFVGGFVVTCIITLLSVLYGQRHIRKKYGDEGAFFFMLLMSTYPGIMYWCGTAFSQVTVVPLCILFYVLMREYEENPTSRRAWWMSVIFGIGFLGYDLGAFFMPAALLLFCHKRRWMHLPLVLVMLAPSVLINMFYAYIGMNVMNANTGIYKNILEAYMHMDWATFVTNLRAVPDLLWHNYIDSQFRYLGWLGLLLLPLTALLKGRQWSAAGISLILGILFIFMFNNMAPAYEGWAIKGLWVARIYQPVFVVIVFAAASLFGAAKGKPVYLNLLRMTVMLVFAVNAYAVFAPIAGNYDMVVLYEQFYHHSPHGTFEENIRKYGAKPLGF